MLAIDSGCVVQFFSNSVTYVRILKRNHQKLTNAFFLSSEMHGKWTINDDVDESSEFCRFSVELIWIKGLLKTGNFSHVLCQFLIDTLSNLEPMQCSE